MSKSIKKQTVANRDAFTRVNFLFQASILMAGQNNTLSSYYGELCKKISQKSVLRMAPDMKRWLCKKCSLAQNPSVTADMNVLKKKTSTKRRSRRKNVNVDDGSNVVLSCRQCGFTCSYEVNTNYPFWLENSDCIVETVKDQGSETEQAGKNETKTEMPVD